MRMCLLSHSRTLRTFQDRSSALGLLSMRIWAKSRSLEVWVEVGEDSFSICSCGLVTALGVESISSCSCFLAARA
eukprot:5198822-Pyramimonas_sp.AAC.1